VNILMAALAVQMALYAAGWVALGWRFRLQPVVSLTWSAGWFLSALGAALVYWQPPGLSSSHTALLTNTAILLSFVLLHRGVVLYTGAQPSAWVAWSTLAAPLLIEVSRTLYPDAIALRAWIFTLAVFAPLGLTASTLFYKARLWVGASRANFALIALPVVLTLVVFVVRALAITFHTVTGQVELDTGTQFDFAMTLLFLVMLGLFNYSLYSLVLGSLVRRLEDLASTDQLTGLNNRRVMIERLDEEHARFLRSGQRYALVMMDLDHFKIVNDTYGHSAGDAVLREVAERLRASVRSTDTLARLGGEEFLLLLPMNDIDGALVHAGRIRKHIAATPIACGSASIPITLSLGVAEVFHSDRSSQSVVSRADAALYRAKAAGRNRVEAAERAPLPAPVP
jgi:diguanylate cyclase (GGDEF)-like protein